MRPLDNIEKLIKKLRYKSSTEAHDRVLGNVLQALEKSEKQKPAASQPNIWRIIMKSKITKFAAAAVIIMAVVVGIHQLGGSIDGASVAFAQVAEAVKKAPWMSIVCINRYGGERESRFDVWLSFESKIKAYKHLNGTASYRDFSEHTKYVYDPDSHTVTISDFSGEFSANAPRDPWNICEWLINEFPESEAQVIQWSLDEAGLDVFGFNRIRGELAEKARMIVDAEKGLPILIQYHSTDLDGSIIEDASLYFDYPKNGPSDIYDLGVPESADVVGNAR